MAGAKDVRALRDSKPVKITLTDGVERTLRFTLNAMAELEEKYGSVDAAFEQLDKGSFKAIRTILWAGLMHEEPILTEQQVGNLMDLQSMAAMMETVGLAVKQDTPDPVQLKVTGEVSPDPNA